MPGAQQKAPSSGAFLPSSLMYFFSGKPMHFLSGVDRAQPYSMIIAARFDCSGLHKSEADAEDAAHQTRRYGESSRTGSSRSAFHNSHSAMVIAA
jgi:hypothetical protein